MASTDHKKMMKELRARKKALGFEEFRADVLPEEKKYLQQIVAGLKLQRRLNGMGPEYWQ